MLESALVCFQSVSEMLSPPGACMTESHVCRDDQGIDQSHPMTNHVTTTFRITLGFRIRKYLIRIRYLVLDKKIYRVI